MDAPQFCWRGHRGHSLPLVLLCFLASTPRLAQGSLDIPDGYSYTNLPEPPVLLEMPSSFTAFSLEDVNLPCEASGNPTPTFRWVKDGEPMDLELFGDGTITAQINDSLDLYHGSYRCLASNTLGTAVTPTVHVIVERHPVVLKQQKVNKNAQEGESLVLSCNPPESSTPPTIHWMDKLMIHVRLSARVTAGLDGSLYFANLVKSDSRKDYICNAQYTAAMTVLPETAVSLHVMPSNSVVHGRKPRLLTPSGSHSSVLALKGDNVTLECIPGGLPTPKVEWTKKQGKLEETSGTVQNHGRWFQFQGVEQNDDGEYQCRAHNEHGDAIHTFTVAVEASPYWVKEPENLRYAPGENVLLDCHAEGIPTPTITWSINGQPLADVDPDPRRSVSRGVLKLMDVEVADTAVYQCEAKNKHGSILHNTFINVIELPPQILTADGLRYRVAEGGDAALQCDSFGSPLPHVTWDHQELSPLLSHSHVSLLTDGTLKVFNVSHTDSGAYVCSVEQSNISISAHLEVYERSRILAGPENLRVIKGSTALLRCEAFTDPRLKQERQIVWRKDGLKIQESSADDKITMFDNGTLRVTDVHSEDSGIYSCEVISGLDHAQASGAISVVAPPDPPKALSLSDIEAHSLTLSWTSGYAHNSPITEFIVESREEKHTEEARWRWEEVKRVPGDFQEVELKLHPFCTYSFRVTAVNSLGRSEPSQPSDSYSTQPAIPSSNPTGVRSESKEPGTLVITWDEMEKRLHNGQGFQYKVWWREAGGGGRRDWDSSYVSGPPFSVTGTGTYTPFEIKVQAVNSIGDGPVPEDKVGHSGEDVPLEAPRDVVVTVMNSTVRVMWDEAKNVRGLLLGYKIYINRLGSKAVRRRRSLEELRMEAQPAVEQERERVVEVRGMKTSEVIAGLKLYSLYELSVTAFNSKGEGPRSSTQSFQTPEGAPGPPASLMSESPTDTSLVLLWSPPVETNGILLGYMVQYQQEEDGTVEFQQIEDPHTTHLELRALNSSVYYLFSVRARTAAGEGPAVTLRAATLLDGVPPTNISIVHGDTYLNMSWVPGERDRNHGFHIRYLRKSAGETWKDSELVNSTQGFYSLSGLQPGITYHLQILHQNNTQWETIIQTQGPVSELTEMSGGFATQGWFIGLISAIILLLLILFILCLVKRRKGGKYAVKDKEDKEVDSEARPMKDETFGEYSDGDEKRSDSQPSLCPSKLGSDDSLAEYGDSVDIQFNEDGSFIGQYSGRGPAPHGHESSGPASPTAAAPPPPLAPSMSTLQRPS